MRFIKNPLIILFLLGGLGWISEKLETKINYDKLFVEELLPLAKGGDAEAQRILESMYELGDGVPQPNTQGVKSSWGQLYT